MLGSWGELHSLPDDAAGMDPHAHASELVDLKLELSSATAAMHPEQARTEQAAQRLLLSAPQASLLLLLLIHHVHLTQLRLLLMLGAVVGRRLLRRCPTMGRGPPAVEPVPE